MQSNQLMKLQVINIYAWKSMYKIFRIAYV